MKTPNLLSNWRSTLKLCLLWLGVPGLMLMAYTRFDSASAKAAPPVSSPAMVSPAYTLDWFTPLTTSAGGHIDSANYSIDFSLGQVAPGKVSSTGYAARLGFWAGLANLFRLMLPDMAR